MSTTYQNEEFEAFCAKYETRCWVQIDKAEFKKNEKSSRHIQALKSDLHNGYGYMSTHFSHAPDAVTPFFKCDYMLADLEAAAALHKAGLSEHLDNPRAELLAETGIIDNTYAEMFYFDGFAYMHLFATEDKDDLFFKAQVVFEISTHLDSTYVLDTYRGKLLDKTEGIIQTILDIRVKPRVHGQMALMLTGPKDGDSEYLVSGVITSIK